MSSNKSLLEHQIRKHMPLVNLEALKGLQAMHRLGQEQMVKRHALLKGVNPTSRKLQTGQSIHDKMAKDVAMKLVNSKSTSKNYTLDHTYDDYGKSNRLSQALP